MLFKASEIFRTTICEFYTVCWAHSRGRAL